VVTSSASIVTAWKRMTTTQRKDPLPTTAKARSRTMRHHQLHFWGIVGQHVVEL